MNVLQLAQNRKLYIALIAIGPILILIANLMIHSTPSSTQIESPLADGMSAVSMGILLAGLLFNRARLSPKALKKCKNPKEYIARTFIITWTLFMICAIIGLCGSLMNQDLQSVNIGGFMCFLALLSHPLTDARLRLKR